MRLGASLLCAALASLTLHAGAVQAQIPQDPAKLVRALRSATTAPPGMSAEQRKLLDAAIAAVRADPQAGSVARTRFAAFAKSYFQRPDPRRLTEVVLYVVMSAARPQDRAALDAMAKQAEAAAEASRTGTTASQDRSSEDANSEEQKRTVTRLAGTCNTLYGAGLPPDDGV